MYRLVFTERTGKTGFKKADSLPWVEGEDTTTKRGKNKGTYTAKTFNALPGSYSRTTKNQRTLTTPPGYKNNNDDTKKSTLRIIGQQKGDKSSVNLAVVKIVPDDICLPAITPNYVNWSPDPGLRIPRPLIRITRSKCVHI
ncbi:hypothetical protein KQX54_017433 [Cotesia glomerata]|uniref:Uncharacterized protein n=1 Tax=Cotesia glomerata TaxID=32391 RepID=A0AAV7IGD0_COTGL|nr:hypothetical protein KQX54_017433 [Cotesia glomerata]